MKDEQASISKADLAKHIENVEVKAGLMDLKAFTSLDGENFFGLNILALEPGEAGGPYTLKEILKDQDLTPPAKAGKKVKKMDPVDVYVALTVDRMEIRMPIAASFVEKARAANLAPGDSFAVLRTENYVSKQWGTVCAGYALKVLVRAAKK